MEKILYTVQEVSKLMKVNKHYVYALIKNGELPVVKIGSLKIRAEAIETFLLSKEERMA